MRKNKVNLGFKTCVLKENQDEIRDIENFVGSLGALHRLDDTLSRRLDGSDEPFKFRGIHKTQYIRGNAHDAIGDAQIEDCNTQSQNLEPKTRNLFQCGVGQTQAAITPSGELKMCLMIDYPKYNILKSSLKACWGKLKNYVSKIKPDSNYRCDECALQSYCKWCPARSWLYNKNFTTCDLESRQWAEFRRQKIETRDESQS